MAYLFVAGKVLLGLYFLVSGYKHFANLKMLTGYTASKKIPLPREMVLLTGFMLAFGGIGLLTGFLVQYAIITLSVFLLVTNFTMHQFWTLADPMQKMGERINFEKNLALLGALLMLLPVSFLVW
jgi:uncharacterized membrane protein YphA (DoxX/SURF4 family)